MVEDSELVMHGAGTEENSDDIFGEWPQDRSLSFATMGPKLQDESLLELGDSKLRIAAREKGQKDKSGRKYALVSYLIPVMTLTKTQSVQSK